MSEIKPAISETICLAKTLSLVDFDKSRSCLVNCLLKRLMRRKVRTALVGITSKKLRLLL